MHQDHIAELQRKLKVDEERRRQFVATYGHIRRPTGVTIDGKLFMAFDGAIYKQTQEGPYNFINAIHDHALHFFGNDYLDAEDSKNIEDRHPAIQWLHSHFESANTRNNSTYQDGNGAAWYRFAYDLFTIRDNEKLQEQLKKRLIDSVTFQAARYELKVAAICSTAGFDLSFENETDNSKKHPEFIGVDRFTGVEIAVEAKSRHRNGILGFSNGTDSLQNVTLGIRRNILDAYRKSAMRPFYVFIDANLPPRTPEQMSQWEDELVSTFTDLEIEGYADPCPANAVLVTNDPSHYVGRGEIGYDSGSLWVRCYTAQMPYIANPSEEIVERFLIAHKQRVAPPTEFHEDP